ncbi:hypothetical protein GJAV_G00190060 [Gymnothorax javanicus]|nr:hypothetical protein GJAV_G00190060 [Gymnothorax javanicus]
MPKSCSAYNCTNRHSSKNPDLTFHRFPFSKPLLLRKWLQNIGREDFQPKRHMVICSHHFTPESFSGFGNRKNLLWNAVPTLFTFPASPLERRKSKKKLRKDIILEFKREEILLEGPDSQPKAAREEVVVPAQKKHTTEQQLSSLIQDFGTVDHSYAMSNPSETKMRLSNMLNINRRLRGRLKVKCQMIQKLRLKLREAQRKLAGLRAGQDCIQNLETTN